MQKNIPFVGVGTMVSGEEKHHFVGKPRRYLWLPLLHICGGSLLLVATAGRRALHVHRLARREMAPPPAPVKNISNVSWHGTVPYLNLNAHSWRGGHHLRKYTPATFTF